MKLHPKANAIRHQKAIMQTDDCFSKLQVDQQCFERLQSWVKNSKVEIGGNFKIDFKKGSMKIGEVVPGEFDSVALRRGLIDWHLHPATCMEINKDEEKCTLPVPSTHDLTNVLTGASMGTVAHFLFVVHGSFVIIAGEKVLAEFHKNKHTFIERMNNRLLLLKKHTVTQGWTLNQISVRFLRAIQDIGFDVQFFKKKVRPGCELSYKCFLNSSKPLSIQSKNIERSEVPLF